MTSAKYDRICAELRDRIEQGEYGYQELLSSEDTLVGEFGCSRNTVRRAVRSPTGGGYVQDIHGKGVRIVYQPYEQSEFMLSGIENLKEAMARNEKKYTMKVVCFTELQVDKKIHTRTAFPIGEEIYHARWVHYTDGKALIIDHNYFLKSVVWKLVPEIAERSVHEYMEQALGETIMITKRKMAVEQQTEIGSKHPDSKDYNYSAVASSMTYNVGGAILEYTQSRHRSGCFMFYDTAHHVK